MNQVTDNGQKAFAASDWALLYLRIVVGGALLLHNVAKMQDYNVIISAYSQMWGVSGATWYVVLSGVEVVGAFMLIIGRWVRGASVMLIGGTMWTMILYFKSSTPLFVELQSLYVMIYILFLITGGGYYSMDRVRYYRRRSRVK